MRVSRLPFGALAPLSAVLCVLLWGGFGANAQNYIGAERCRTCHEFEYERWERGPHAGAHLILNEEQLADAKCNSCHTMVAESGQTKPLMGVQCERCHGPGKYYSPHYVMRDSELSRAVGLIDPKPDHCSACHTEGTPAISPFDYASMWQEIDHGPAARADWEKAKSEAAVSAP